MNEKVELLSIKGVRMHNWRKYKQGKELPLVEIPEGIIKEDENYVINGIDVISIGRKKSEGRIFASVDSIYFENPEYECIWFRT